MDRERLEILKRQEVLGSYGEVQVQSPGTNQSLARELKGSDCRVAPTRTRLGVDCLYLDHHFAFRSSKLPKPRLLLSEVGLVKLWFT